MKIITNCAGFFSNFLKYIAWTLCYGKDEKIIFHFVDIPRNPPINYLTHDIAYKENIWNIIFEKPDYELADLIGHKCEPEYPTDGFPSPLNTIVGGYPHPNCPVYAGYIYCNSAIYRHEHFQRIREIYHGEIDKLPLTPYIKEYIHKNSNTLVNPEKTIAVFIRFPGQRHDRTDYILDMISEVEELMNKNEFDYIYLVTMIDSYARLFYEKFKDKVIFFGNKRFTQIHKDWIDDVTDYKQECIDCFSEVYVASKCKYAIGSSSNMLLGCLFFNPTMEFKLFDVTANSNGL